MRATHAPVLGAVLRSAAGHGALSLAADGSFSYTPNPGFSGADSFQYSLSDASNGASSANATVTISVTATAPVANNDSGSVTAGNTLTVSAPGVLANDSGPAGDALTAVLVSGPAHGSLTLNADGSFRYTPQLAYQGLDSFTYKAHDTAGNLDSNVATVSVAVGQSAAAFGVIPQPPQPPTPMPIVLFLPLFSISVNIQGCGSVTPADGGGLHLFGDTVTLQAVPCAGSSFAGWQGGPCDGTAINPCAVVMPPNNLVITASFRP
ncbi:MAG TPA: Ig-like domain-containing protein [Dehalococcoidia bacterium]|nr:Ig-like domain-containing protein [Dehalococcoidia bacterium]